MKGEMKYVKVASHEANKGEFKKCLLLYSGGLDTSVMLKWIQDHYESKVVCLTLDIGQVADNLEEIKKKALKLGAVEAYVHDAKKEFAEKYLREAIFANADYQGGYALGCPLGRVVISELAVKYAQKTGCTVIAHGCTGKGNDQVRFEGYVTTLDNNLKIIAPVREWGMGRDEELAYAKKHNIPVLQTSKSPYSYDENMWSNTAEGGEIENPELTAPLDRILRWCKTPQQAADKVDTVTLDFEKGVPVAMDGKKLELWDLIMQLNKRAGKAGCGFHQIVEDRIVGLKVRGVYENPAASVLIAAHKKLEYLVSTREENEFKNYIDQKWAYLCYGAKYFEPTMNHIRAYLDSANERVTGTAKVTLYKGQIWVASTSSPYSLFNSSMATFDADLGAFNHNASGGFIELYNLAQKTSHAVGNQAGKKRKATGAGVTTKKAKK
jgi:argininosuccinate synthase